MNDARKTHWDNAYLAKPAAALSWFQSRPAESLQLIEKLQLPNDASIIDIGAGASTLVDQLLASGYLDISILDISAVALHEVKKRLGSGSTRVSCIESNVLDFAASRQYALWHDRAAFHFLTSAQDRRRYIRRLRQSLLLKGYLVLATFGPEGPQRCSGLPVQRYGVEQLQALLGNDFVLQRHILHDHHTPGGFVQQFLYSCWQFVGDSSMREG